MSHRREVIRWFAMMVLPLAAGCASSGGGGAPAGDTPAGAVADGSVQVVVMNNRVDASEATIFWVPSAGVRTQLGIVDAGATRTFTAPKVPGPHTITAQTTSGSRSANFPLYGNTTRLTWDMSNNTVRQTSGEPAPQTR